MLGGTNGFATGRSLWMELRFMKPLEIHGDPMDNSWKPMVSWVAYSENSWMDSLDATVGTLSGDVF